MPLPYPYSYNYEQQLAEDNPLVNLLRSRAFAMILLFVALLQPFEAFSANCATQSQLVCLDSTPCKTISGVEVCLASVSPLPAGALQSKQTCWQAQGTYSCVDPTVVNSTCGTLQANPACGVTGSVCSVTDAGGNCTVYTDTYQCQTGGGLAATSTDCSGQTYCSNGTCFSKKDGPNNAIAKVVTAMELTRQAGFYMDPATMTIFKGDSDWCSVNTLGLANCCKPNTTGAGATDAMIANLLIQGGWAAWTKGYIGSSYTFDTLFDKAVGYVDEALNGMGIVVNQTVSSGAQQSVIAATTPSVPATPVPGSGTLSGGAAVGSMLGGTIGAYAGSALASKYGANTIWSGVAGAGGYAGGAVLGTYAGAYASYAIAVAETSAGFGGTAAAGTAAAGFNSASVVIAWEAIIAVVIIMIIMALLACSPPEIKTQLKLGAGLCHEVGASCSAKGPLGTCLTMHHNSCCFNSVLGKVVQEQGRPQISKSWGSAAAPDCTGFTVAELQSLDFSKMDLSAFFSQVVAQNMPDPATLSSNVQQTMQNFYNSTPASSMNGVLPGPAAGTPVPLTVTQVSPPTAPAMPACNVALTKVAPASTGDQTGTFTVSSCLANGLADWAYTGNCPSLQGITPTDTNIDANGNTTFTATVPAACMAATAPATSWTNGWSVRVFDTPTGLLSGTFQSNW